VIRYRPVPLDQTFIGVTEHNPIRRKFAMNDICFKKVLASVLQGHQVMVFVHSRKETVTTAQFLREQFLEAGRADLLHPNDHAGYDSARQAVMRSRNYELKDLFTSGLSFHNAGMLRSDRSWVEKTFTAGVVRVLVCTATLAWGVNLPAHTVVIKSTEIYDAKKGGFTELSMLDVMQIFGRAGRPQYDTSGEAILITTHDKLAHYLHLLNHAMPIESTFIESLENHLNAEIISGTVTNLREAIAWLSYTYLYVRMLRNPMAYGISWDERALDPLLLGKRKSLIEICARALHRCRMVRFDEASGNFFATDLGRTASYYYVHYQSIEVFNSKLKQFMTDEEVFDCIASSKEFEQIKVREEEVRSTHTHTHTHTLRRVELSLSLSLSLCCWSCSSHELRMIEM
jgi:activating signal cointegrator complex subunit 3